MNFKSKEDFNQEIMCIIRNRFYEHGHPFKTGSSGMVEFAKLVGILSPYEGPVVMEYIDEIYKLFSILENCNSCKYKLWVYLGVMCCGKLPGNFDYYKDQIIQFQKEIRPDSSIGRNYIAEIRESVLKTNADIGDNYLKAIDLGFKNLDDF